MITLKYKNLYEKFINHYKTTHVNPWHNISEFELEKLYNNLSSTMDVIDDYTFTYFINYIIKRLSATSDAHTKFDKMECLPINFRIFDNNILVNYPSELKGSKVISINNIKIEEILKEIEEVIIYGTLGKRKYEQEKALFNKFILFGLPSLRNTDKLIFKLEKNGEIIEKEYEKEIKYDKELFDYEKYRYGSIADYKIDGKTLIYNHKSVQPQFKEKIETTIEKLKKEDLTNIDTIIVDIRGNTGGNSGLNKIVMEFLENNKDKKIIALTDYRVFSSGSLCLIDLIRLGAFTIGEEISTPFNCYGETNRIEIDGYYFSVSASYFNPMLNFGVRTKEDYINKVNEEILKPIIYKPNIIVEERMEDYIKGKDTILEYALEYSEVFRRKNAK